MKILLSLLVLSVAASATAVAAAESPVVIAHRSASGYLPEHTLPSVAYAHALGADYLEQDVVLSKDGVPLVLHDIEIDTVTDVATRFPGRQRANGHFYAIDFTLAEIRQLRAHERCDPKTGRPVYPRRFPIGQSTFAVPTLEEDLQFVQGLNRSTNEKSPHGASRVFAIDPATGAVTASLQKEGWLYRLALEDGRVLARQAMPPGIEGLVQAGADRLWSIGECDTRRRLSSRTFFPVIFEIDLAALSSARR